MPEDSWLVPLFLLLELMCLHYSLSLHFHATHYSCKICCSSWHRESIKVFFFQRDGEKEKDDDGRCILFFCCLLQSEKINLNIASPPTYHFLICFPGVHITFSPFSSSCMKRRRKVISPKQLLHSEGVESEAIQKRENMRRIAKWGTTWYSIF